MDEDTVYASTYAPLLKAYFDDHDQFYETLISKKEVEAIAKTLYGKDWMQKIKNWNKTPDPKMQESMITN